MLLIGRRAAKDRSKCIEDPARVFGGAPTVAWGKGQGVRSLSQSRLMAFGKLWEPTTCRGYLTDLDWTEKKEAKAADGWRM